MRVLSTHPLRLVSQYRGPTILNTADPPAPAPTEPTPPVPAPTEPTPPSPSPAKTDDTEGRISELAKANKELKAQLKAIEDAKKEEEEAKSLKKGEHEKVIAERTKERDELKAAQEAATQQLAAYEAVLKAQLEAGLKGIADEKKRETAKKLLDGKSLADQVALLPEVLSAIGAPAPATFGGATPASTSTPTATDIERKKARYSELLAKPSPTPKEMQERLKLMTELTTVWNEEQTKKTTN